MILFCSSHGWTNLQLIHTANCTLLCFIKFTKADKGLIYNYMKTFKNKKKYFWSSCLFSTYESQLHVTQFSRSAGELFTSFYFPWSSPCCPLIFFSSIDWEVVRLGVKDYPVIFVFHKTVLFLLISFIRTNRSHIFLLLLFVFFFIPSTKYVFLNNGLFSFFFFYICVWGFAILFLAYTNIFSLQIAPPKQKILNYSFSSQSKSNI